MKILDDGGLTHLINRLKAWFDLKVDKEAGKGLSTNDYTTAEKNKLSGIETGANKYVHPETHPAGMIIQTATHRFVSDSEKSGWNAKADISDIPAPRPINTDASKLTTGILPDARLSSGIARTSALNTHISDNAKHVAGTERIAWNAKADMSDIPDISGKADITYVDTEIASIPEVDISGKQDKLTFDDAPTADSDNPVKSGGIYDALQAVDGEVGTHVARKDNPHSVTKVQIGLSNVNNTSDVDKPISTATQTALNAKQDKLTFATEAEAIGGSNNTTLMTPLRVDQAFNEKFKVIDGVLNVFENGEWVEYVQK